MWLEIAEQAGKALAYYAGLIFLVVAALLGAPVFHRLLHKLLWEDTK